MQKKFNFEAITHTYHQLVENKRTLANVQCENIALGAACGTITVWLKESIYLNPLKQEVNPRDVNGHQSQQVVIMSRDKFYFRQQVNRDEVHLVRHFNQPELELFAVQTGFAVLHAEEFLSARQSGTEIRGMCFVRRKD
jgi:hypothetical protein